MRKFIEFGCVALLAVTFVLVVPKSILAMDTTVTETQVAPAAREETPAQDTQADELFKAAQEAQMAQLAQLAQLQAAQQAALAAQQQAALAAQQQAAAQQAATQQAAALAAQQEAVAKAAQEAQAAASQAPIVPGEAAPEVAGSRTYVDVNIGSQTLTYFVDGAPVLSTPCVTGSPGRSTPTGVFAINSLVPGKYLTGPTWHVWVNRWMRFSGNCGIHDASWRKAFGGNIYKSNGSHGCVNIPRSAADQLYGMVSLGTIVVVH